VGGPWDSVVDIPFSKGLNSQDYSDAFYGFCACFYL